MKQQEQEKQWTGLPLVAKLRREPSQSGWDSTQAHPSPLSKVRSLDLTKEPERILGFDLENRPLAYWYDGQTTSEITAFGWKWVGESEVHTMLLRHDTFFQCDDGSRIQDGAAYDRFVEELSSADLVFGHNIRRHDLPILQAALLRREKPILPVIKTTDTLSDYPKRSGMSASLENLVQLYGLSMPKKGMGQVAWEKANRLQDDGIELAQERVVSDVILQEELRDKLLSLSLLSNPKDWKPRRN